jgi:hypothetical protein
MSTTRHGNENTDDAHRAVAGLSHPLLKGINVGLNVVCRVAQVRTEAEAHAMIWLTNYARLMRRTGDALSDELGLDKEKIREALSRPDFEGMKEFVSAVSALRRKFEDDLVKPAETHVSGVVRSAVKTALNERVPVRVEGKWRLGKTVVAEYEFLMNLHQAVWVETPTDNSERTFIDEVGRALGVSLSGGKKVAALRTQIKGVFATGMLKLFFVDEAHYLFPVETDTRPKRLDFVREIFDMRGVRLGIVLLCSEQYSLAMQDMLNHNTKWAPGQWDGREIPFPLRDSLKDHELAAIARWHAPQADKEAIAYLVEMAKANEGYAGKAVNCIKLARQIYLEDGKLTVDSIRKAQGQMEAPIRKLELATASRRLKGFRK